MFSSVTGEQVLEVAGRVARRYAREYHEREDLIGEVCLRAVEQGERIDAADEPIAYLWGLARNVCKRAWERRNAIPLTVELMEADQLPAPMDPAEVVPTRIDIYRFLRESGMEPVLARRLARGEGDRYETREKAQVARREAFADQKRMQRAVKKYGHLLAA